MTHQKLRERVCRVNRSLGRSGLVLLTWGNVSGVDRASGVFAIKPSGVPYDELRPEAVVVVELDSGDTVDAAGRPSSDAPTHRALYLSFPEVGGIVHTHSEFATAWAQAAQPIPCLGTTHADGFAGRIPITRNLRATEIEDAYEWHTGMVVAEYFDDHEIDPGATPGVLLPHHGPFTWGVDPESALEHAVVLEAVARMAWYSRVLAPGGPEAPECLARKHFARKHGPNAYYGQK